MKSRLIFMLMTLASLTLLACQPRGFSPKNYALNDENSTGLINEDGFAYTKGADVHIAGEIKKEAPTNIKNPTNIDLRKLELSQSVKKIQMLRFNKDGKVERFGLDHFLIRFRLEAAAGSAETIDFEISKFNKRSDTLTFQNISAKDRKDFFLNGVINDSQKQDVTSGIFDLYQIKSGQDPIRIRIFQKSYLADMKLKTNAIEASKLSRNMRTNLKSLSENAYAWVSNWVVILGPSFYDVQILKIITPTLAGENNNNSILSRPAEDRSDANSKLIFRFSGESLRTNDSAGHPAQEIENGQLNPKAVVLKGDAEQFDERLFFLTFEDKKTGKSTQAYLDVRTAIQKTETIPQPLALPHSQPPVTPQTAITSGSLFAMSEDSINRPRIAKVLKDLNRNWQVDEVREWIDFWTKKGKRPSKTSGLNSEAVRNYLHNARPLSDAVSKIFQFYNLSPHLSLMTFVESSFYTGGKYAIEVSPLSTATGPYQFLFQTATGYNLRVDQNSRIGHMPRAFDERRYFVPATCGAARMMSYNVDLFKKDATMAFLAFRIGEGAAASAVHCTYSPSTDDADKMAKCSRRVGRAGFTGKDYGRFLDEMKGFDFSYADIANLNMISKEYIDYVNQILALYFVSLDPEKYGFESNRTDFKKIPESVLMPKDTIKDSSCRKAINDKIPVDSQFISLGI